MTGIIRDPRTGDDYEFNSRGTWVIDWLGSFILLPSSQAVYNWPQSPTGWWPAFNLDRGGGPARIKIRQGRAVCHGGGNLSFIQYYGVTLEDDNIYKKTSSIGGGGGGGGENCWTEHAIIEIDYGDGTGWHELWRGYVTVCE
ncbi:MAG: hypothetical protein ACYC3Q_13300 [Gemmatimonadaceae bacterium]